MLFDALAFSTVANNSLSTALAVLFAYIVNKVYVFDSPNWSMAVVVSEFAKFSIGRMGVFVLETLVLFLVVDVFGFDSVMMKACTMVMVVVSNYCISKWVVFRKAG